MADRGRPRHPDILTPREWEVLALLRDQHSNEEISQRLGISVSGVKYHVSEILGKLGVESRDDAARWARDRRQTGGLPLSWASLSKHLRPSTYIQFAGLARVGCCVVLIATLAWGVARSGVAEDGSGAVQRTPVVGQSRASEVFPCDRHTQHATGFVLVGIPPARRAIAIPVFEDQTARELTPGDWVDLYMEYEQVATSVSLARCVEVLAVAHPQTSAPGPNGVTPNARSSGPADSTAFVVTIAVEPQVVPAIASWVKAGGSVRVDEIPTSETADPPHYQPPQY